MVRGQIQARGVEHPGVLQAMRDVPRELFVPDDVRHLATRDSPLTIGAGQTISQPYIVALMAEAAAGSRHRLTRVLEVGTGCGYGAAVLAQISDTVTTIERIEVLAERARENLELAGCDNVDVVVGDGTLGHPDDAPYDAIVVTAAGPDFSDALLAQLADGGRLVAPIGQVEDQRLMVVVRHGDRLSTEDLGPVRFVPLIGEMGWSN